MGLTVRRIITSIILIVIIDQVARIVYMLGFHKNVYTHHPGLCRSLSGIENGSEDIVTASNGLAFISSGVLKMVEPDQVIPGKVFLFDFKHPDQDPQDIQIVEGDIDIAAWIPVGMDIWESGPKDNPKLSLYVVNKQPDRKGIEVFDFSYFKEVPTLTHRKRIHHKNIWSPNDLVLVGEDRFYTSNDVYLPHSIDFLEIMFRLSFGSVAFYDGREARIVAEGLKLSNGVSLSPDKKLLYVSSSCGNELFIYRTKSDWTLEKAKVIALSTFPDNIDVDKDDGSLWVGCNPIMHTFVNRGGTVNGVGQVLNIQLDEELNPTIREVFADDTGLTRASSVACRYGNGMLIGTVAHKAAYCEGILY